ncbi:hypothetical protein [Mesobacillus maritimus]|uniref:hypothetical protein n=1 Tax=Mesobacillus maritimus TaxID=1643336 RepID=UPI00384CB1F2
MSNHRIDRKFREREILKWREDQNKYNKYTKKYLEQVIDPKTGEIIKAIIPKKDTIVNVIPLAAKEEYEKKKKLEQEIENYRTQGKRKEPFAQVSKGFEMDIIGNYSPAMLSCLVQTIPYMNYTADVTSNSDVIKKGKKPLEQNDLINLWKVSKVTGIKYIKQFIKDGIWEEVSAIKKKGNIKYYRFKHKMVFRGKNQNEFTKKIFLRKLESIISIVLEETEKALYRESTRKVKRFSSLYPLALFAALLTKTHYKTFFLLHNHDDPDLVREGEYVTEILQNPFRKRKFKFLKQYEMWNLYRGNKVKKLKTNEKMELESCLDILVKSNILGRWESGNKKFYLMNPGLIYVSPNKKYDQEWGKVINSLFGLGENIE